MDAESAVAHATAGTWVGRSAPAPAEFIEFYRQRYREVRLRVMYAGASEHEADDITQITMCEVLLRWHNIEDALAYARRAAWSNLLKARREEQARRARNERYMATNFERPADESNFWHDHGAVEELLKLLTTGQREVVHLLMDDLSQAEIAELLGRSYDAVRRSLSDIRHRLRPAIEQRQTSSRDSNRKTLAAREDR